MARREEDTQLSEEPGLRRELWLPHSRDSPCLRSCPKSDSKASRPRSSGHRPQTLLSSVATTSQGAPQCLAPLLVLPPSVWTPRGNRGSSSLNPRWSGSKESQVRVGVENLGHAVSARTPSRGTESTHHPAARKLLGLWLLRAGPPRSPGAPSPRPPPATPPSGDHALFGGHTPRRPIPPQAGAHLGLDQVKSGSRP